MTSSHRGSRFLSGLVLTVAAALLMPLPLSPAPKGLAGGSWRDDFTGGSIDRKRWLIANGGNPGSVENVNQSNALASNVWVSGGYLVIRLDQTMGTVGTNPNGTISNGGAIFTKANYGYGTYEWRMRMSTTSPTPSGQSTENVTGSVSAGFNYVNNSQTEIDFEYAASDPGMLYMTNWHNTDPATGPWGNQETFHTLPLADIADVFHTYTYVWKPGQIDFYVDGILRVTHTENVPSAPAAIIMNHWGTDNKYFGGHATLNVTRYLYVDYVQFTPAR